jgi:DNA polymerase-3 subunit delta'
MPFKDVIGHRKILALLSRSVERASVPPSLIFAGPAGIGKRLVAVSTAQAFNCLSPRRAKGSVAGERVDLDACGTCAACTRIARGVHPDVMLIEPGDSGSIKIDPIRDVIDRSGYRPFEGRRRVVIIDDAEALVPGAQNALLKTLEEPPSASMFVLVSARPDALLPTVQSRCPKLRFRPLSQEEIAAALVARGRSEHEARTIAASADGSLGRALEASGEELLEARDIALRVLTHAATGDDPRRRIEGAKELLAKTGAGGTSDREQLAIALRALSTLLRDISLLAIKGNRQVLANTDLEAALARLTIFAGERGVRAFQAVDQALLALERNAGVKVVADWVTLAL